MINMQIVIITDGNSTLGMGHVYQSLTLAETLLQVKDINADITFITKSDKPIVDLIEKRGFKVICLQNDDLIFDKLKELNPDRIIFDKLDVSPDLAKNIKEKLGIKLIIFTNLTEANDYADVTVLADIGSDFENIYTTDSESGQVKFFGPKYWLLRPEFYQYQKDSNAANNPIKNIMLMFGGADPCNISSGVLNELLKMDAKFSITLVLGVAFQYHQELNRVITSNNSSLSSVKIVEKISNVGETIFNNDLVFASPGLSFFESLAVGTPIIGFHQNDLQRDVYKGFLETFDKKEIYKTKTLIESKSFIFPDDPYIKNMEIGKGKGKIIFEIIK